MIHADKLTNICKRWHVVCLSVYEEVQRGEYLFVGVNGDQKMEKLFVFRLYEFFYNWLIRK